MPHDELTSPQSADARILQSTSGNLISSPSTSAGTAEDTGVAKSNDESTLLPGYLNHVFQVFNDHKHPFVIIEEAAMAWMALHVHPNEDLDILVRDAQLDSILASLLATGRFKLAKHNPDSYRYDHYIRSIPRLECDSGVFYPYLSLWPESLYMLSVDGDNVEVPDLHAWNHVLMEDRFDPGESTRTRSLSYQSLTEKQIRVLPPVLARNSEISCAIYVPSIPRLLDALLDQCRYYEAHPGQLLSIRPGYHIDNFIRYLHLEKLWQEELLIPTLAERNQNLMEWRISRFKRKPRIMGVENGKIITAPG
ncbi:MAG: hypothetical protein M1819_000563 [Sarea resinae]|nr:MAG: hypothetical protein M1819_000563 [Sarea resinae]